MMRLPSMFSRRNGPFQVVIISLMLIITPVVVGDNPALGLNCDRTTHDYSGWRKKEWMDSWFNKKLFIPDNLLTGGSNSKSMHWERRSVSSTGRETILRFQLLPNGKMIAKMKQSGSDTVIQRYKCDKTPAIVKAERKARYLAEEKKEAELAAKKEADEKAKLEAEITAKLEAEMAAKKKAEEEAAKKAELTAALEAETVVKEVQEEEKNQGLTEKEKAEKEEEAKRKAELAAKKKAEKEEEAKRKAELAAKKKAELAAKKKAQAQKTAEEMKLAQREIVDLREASIDFVKTGENLDVLAWSEYLGKLPIENDIWNTNELKTYQEFRKFAFSTEGFEDFYDAFLQRKQVLAMKRYGEILEVAKKVERGLSEAVVDTIGTKESKRFSTALKALQKAMETPEKITASHNTTFDALVKRQEAILESYRKKLARETELREQIKIVKSALEELDKSGLPSKYTKLVDDTLDELVEVVAVSVAELGDLVSRANRALDSVKSFQNKPSNSGESGTQTELTSSSKEFSLDQTTSLWNEGGPAFSKFREKWIRRKIFVTGVVTEKRVSQDGDTLFITLDPNPGALYRNATAVVHWVEKEKIALIQQSQLIGQVLTFEGILSSFNNDRSVSIDDSKLR